MPAKKKTDSPDVQGKRFVEDAQKMIDAGELNPIDAKQGLNRLVLTQRDNQKNENER